MKKICISFLTMFLFCAAIADDNVLFDDGDNNSLSIYVAQSTGSGSLLHLFYPGDWEIVPMTAVMVEYAQPMTIFRFPARMNLNLIQNTAYNSARGLSFFGGGISWDVAPISW
ncbi:MAG: hypothetical protein J5611_01365, partial [Alphaproteobacteria bacterium]|nr:hypothetical protein [Alphaproteobacteria bacterium]